MLIFQPIETIGPLSFHAQLSTPSGLAEGHWHPGFGGSLGPSTITVQAGNFLLKTDPENQVLYELTYSSPLEGHFSLTSFDFGLVALGRVEYADIWRISFGQDGGQCREMPLTEGVPGVECYALGRWIAATFPANEPGFGLVAALALAGLWYIRHRRDRVYTSSNPANNPH